MGKEMLEPCEVKKKFRLVKLLLINGGWLQLKPRLEICPIFVAFQAMKVLLGSIKNIQTQERTTDYATKK